MNWTEIVGKNIIKSIDWEPLVCETCKKPISYRSSCFCETINNLNDIINEMEIFINIKKLRQNYFEELIEKTWHPSRVIDWCLDNSEKKYLFSI